MTGTDPTRRRPTGPTHLRSTAWISLGVLAVAVPLGRWASIAFLDARGYDAVDETEPPGLGLLAFLILVAIVLPPALLALWSGLRAWQAGHRSAGVVLAVAGLVTLVVLLGLPVYLSRILGWPVVLALGAGLAAVGWFSRPWRWGRSARLPAP